MAAATTSLLDLINAGLLQAGDKVMVRDIEGELTSQGTIISVTERGTVEYKTPTAFSKAVTNSTSGGWPQVKLKSSGGSTSLLDIKRKFMGNSKRKSRGSGRRDSVDYTPSTTTQRHHHHIAPVSHISVHHTHHDEDGVREIRKRTRSHIDDEDEEDDEAMSEDSDPPTPPPLTPPSPNSNSTPPAQRSTMIAKHIKHSLLPASSPPSSEPTTPSAATSAAPIFPIKRPNSPTSNNGASAPIVLSLKSPPPPGAHTHTKRVVKDIELLVHVESAESIPYEVIGTADSYESLRSRIAHVIHDFPFHQAHELGVYSEYWEKHAGVAYVKPPRNWVDFPSCTTMLLKKIPETIIINNV